jgi:integrase
MLHQEVPFPRSSWRWVSNATETREVWRRFIVEFGEIPIDRFTLDHAERAMQGLPERAKRPATRRAYAQALARTLKLAEYPLRLIERSPLPKGFLPKIGKPPAFPYLYPSEDAALMACPKVPYCDRLLFGILAREGMRAGEAAALRFRDLDLATGSISLAENKTDDPRT